MKTDRLLGVLIVLYGLALLVGFLSLFSPGGQLVNLLTLRKEKGREGVLAIVHIEGPIRFSAPSLGGQDAESVAETLHKLQEKDEVKAVLLRINSPGGTVGAVQEIYNEVLKLKTQGKKIVASLGEVAASGGYYIAAAADKIIANPGTITGSIGVLMTTGNVEGLAQKAGVRLEVIKSGKHKDIGSAFRPLSPEERRMLQQLIDTAYRQFLTAVRDGRHMTLEQVRPVADGRILTGEEARTQGLVDDLGNLYDARQAAIQLAGLKAKPKIVSDDTHTLRSFLRNLKSFTPLRSWTPLADWETWQPPIRLEYRMP